MEHTMRLFSSRPTIAAYCTGCGWAVQAAKTKHPDNFPTADWQEHLETAKQEYLEELQALRATFDANFPPKKGKRR